MVQKADYFSFVGYMANWETGDLSFSYEVGMADGTIQAFSETLHVSMEGVSPERYTSTAVTRILETLHLVLGLSYFKAYVPETISHPYELSAGQANFWNTLYTKGLGEFYYVNDIDFRGKIKFTPHGEGLTPADLPCQEKALILHGGGKDSIVSVEIAKSMGLDFDLFSVKESDIQKDVASIIGKPLCVINRTIDSKLIDLGKNGEIYNGHVPISSIYASISTLYALLHGYMYIVTSNERSATYGSIDYCGISVNHQWSKSQEFETLFRNYISTTITTDIEFFSLLRPLYELKIVDLFTRYPKYFEHFSSSNHNFVLDQSGVKRRWSVDYSKGKVEFVWTLLSAFLSKDDMIRTFEENIYEREDRKDIFRELLGVKDIKPLDCVGTPEEMQVAMYMAHERGEFEDTSIMKYFVSDVLPTIKDIDTIKEVVFSYGDDSHIPENFRRALSDIIKLQ